MTDEKENERRKHKGIPLDPETLRIVKEQFDRIRDLKLQMLLERDQHDKVEPFNKKGKRNARKLQPQEKRFRDFVESNKVNLNSMTLGKIEKLLARNGLEIPRSTLYVYINRHPSKK